MTAPAAPEGPLGPLVTCRTTVEINRDTALYEGLVGVTHSIGYVRMGTTATAIDIVFPDLVALERMQEALQAVHRRLSLREHAGPHRPNLSAVPRG